MEGMGTREQTVPSLPTHELGRKGSTEQEVKMWNMRSLRTEMFFLKSAVREQFIMIAKALVRRRQRITSIENVPFERGNLKYLHQYQ